MCDSDSIQNDDSVGAVTKSEKQYTQRHTCIHALKNLWADEDLMMPVQREMRNGELSGQTQTNTRTHRISA